MNEINYKLIGARIREIRDAEGCSQEQLAWDAGLSSTYLSLIETGRKKPSLGSLLKISNALGITLDELLSGNQLHNPTDYQTDIDKLMSDCTPEEKRFIYEILRSLKSILRKNGWILFSNQSDNTK
mgnify:CR=1